MGGGDLNMKKSWHPVLLVNQERVWKAEKTKAEEDKKLKQLMKERAEERQLAELQALQEQQTGKKKTDKLDWMYATPASGGGIKGEELEDYLLGKRRVDTILKSEDEKMVKEQNLQAVQNANTARDTAAKIREDPLFAIKQQEQAAYHALMSNPLRLKQLREKELGKEGRKEEKRREKEERKREKEERKARKAAGGGGGRERERSRSPRGDRDDRRSHRSYHDRSRSPPPARHDRERDYRPSSSAPRDVDVKRERSPPPRSYRDDHYADRAGPSSRGFDDRRYDARSGPSRDAGGGGGGGGYARDGPPHQHHPQRPRDGPPPSGAAGRDMPPHYRDAPPYARDARPPPPPHHARDRPSAASFNDAPPRGHSEDRKPPPPAPNTMDADRAARLAAMSSNAQTMDTDRTTRLEQLRERDRLALEVEAAHRAQLTKSGVKADVVKGMQREAIFGEGASLEGRLRDAGKRGAARGFD